MNMKSKNTSIEKLPREYEEHQEAAELLGTVPDGISIEKADYLPAYAEWIKPEGADENKVILYFHGSGFVMGSAKSHRPIVGNFAKTVGYRTLLFDYSLTPEFPAPAAIYDSATIYSWMLEQGYQHGDIIFAGDSTGGGIELGTLVKLRDDGIPLPAACIAFSPNLDMTFFGDLTGLPPIMIHVGNDEVLRDDAARFGEQADFYGVDVRVKVWKGMFHGFPLLAPMYIEAAEAMKQVSAFIQLNLHKENRVSAAFLYMTMVLMP